jgi:predicted kinase
LEPLPPPRSPLTLVVVSGLPGTGKSTFCRDLSRRSGAVILESDSLRKLLFPRPSYSWQESRRLFDSIHAAIEHLLQGGVSAILDATNLAERHRQPLYQIAASEGAKLILVEVTAPPEIVASRLAGRSGVSDADVAVYQRMQRSVEEIAREHFVVDTSHPTRPLLDAITREIKASGT